MARWTKAELSAHLSEAHPNGQNVTPREELLRWTLDELKRSHWQLHGFSEWGRTGSPHGPEEADGHG